MYMHTSNFALHGLKMCFCKVKVKENVEITIESRVSYSLRSRPNTISFHQIVYHIIIYFASCFVNSEDIVIVHNFSNKE